MTDALITLSGPLSAPSATIVDGSVRERLIARIVGVMGAEYGVPAPEDERDVPLTIVQEATDEALSSPGSNYDTTSLAMPVAVARAELATAADRSSQRAQANEMLARIIREMYVDETFSGLADGVDLVGGGINIELAGKLVFAEASFRVRYHYLRGDPYHLDVTELP
jgi:hypothetical protein